MIDKRLLNIIVIIVLTHITFAWTFWIFHENFLWNIVESVVIVRVLASVLLFKDYSLSWSKATQRTFLIKSIVYIIAFVVYAPFIYENVRLALMLSELAFYIFMINFLMYTYYFAINRSKAQKTKTMIIYGAGKAGLKLEEEYRDSEYKVKYFVDDNENLQKRSIDGIRIVSKQKLKEKIEKEGGKFDLLVIAMPSASQHRINIIYERLKDYFNEIKILPPIDKILDKNFLSKELKQISVEDLLARYPKDLDKVKIKSFIKDKIILVTGAGGSIGSEICRQCVKFGAKKLILLDHSEYNLYSIEQELKNDNILPVMQSVVDIEEIEKTFQKYSPDIVIHAAAYKHVPLCEQNITEAIKNNIIGTKNIIDTAVKHNVKKVVLISTDKAVRPTNVMGTTKRICELYAQNVSSKNTEIVAVRFGNVLGSSGSVIPKFKEQIQNGGPITVTHPDITRYFMLIPEACELVLQAASIGKGGEIFILDMGEPIKIVDLAKKMIELSGKHDIDIVFTGLRPGEKLYEELLIDETDTKTEYESITVAKPTPYDISLLKKHINELLISQDKLAILKQIVPEFNHQSNK